MRKSLLGALLAPLAISAAAGTGETAVWKAGVAKVKITPEMWEEGGYEVRESYMVVGLPAPWKRDVTKTIIGAAVKMAEAADAR